MKKKNGVKIIQTAGYNGARTVIELLYPLEQRPTSHTLAISKLLCKENAGAILKPLLISNE